MTALFSLLRRPGLAASAGLLAAMLLPGCSRTYGPVPSEAQLEWQKMEYRLGRYLTGKIINGKTYYNIDYEK